MSPIGIQSESNINTAEVAQAKSIPSGLAIAEGGKGPVPKDEHSRPGKLLLGPDRICPELSFQKQEWCAAGCERTVCPVLPHRAFLLPSPKGKWQRRKAVTQSVKKPCHSGKVAHENYGMIATGNHIGFNSLRDAPLTWESPGFSTFLFKKLSISLLFRGLPH